MRCPGCDADCQVDTRCPDCGGRLFAWLGDPFGNQDLPSSGAAIASGLPARPAPQPLVVRQPSYPLGKLTAVCLVAFVLASRSLLAAVAITALAAVLLWRRPATGWGFVAAGLIGASVLTFGVAEQSKPKPVAAPRATVPPAPRPTIARLFGLPSPSPSPAPSPASSIRQDTQVSPPAGRVP
jgi:hypothetical protein